MTLLEWIATLLGIGCVALAAVRSVWTFPVAIGSVTIIGFVVFEARLYSDAILQIFFVAANVYGWAGWARARARTGDVPVRRMAPGERRRWTAVCIAAIVAWGGLMHGLTDASYPWWDAGIAIVSVAAQLLMGQRRIESWVLWIAVDVASVPLYFAKGLHLFAGLYVIYLALAVWGWLDWRSAFRRAGPVPA